MEYGVPDHGASDEREGLVCQGAVVIRVEGASVTVQIDSHKGCESCGSKGHCGALFGSATVLELRSDRPLSVGQQVEIGMRPAAVLAASTLLFLFPAIAFIIGIVTGYSIAPLYGWSAQWTGFAAGIIAGALSYFVVRLLTPRLQRGGGYEPVITRVLDM